MKIIKKILIVVGVVIVSIIVLPLIIALFVKSEYSMEKEIIINKPKQQVFDYVKLLKNEENYNIWVMADPTMKKEIRGTDGTVGCVYAWDGNDQAGAGEQEIKSIVEGERINTELRFIRPFEGVANAYTATETVSENQTKVKYGMSGKNPYPMNFMNLFMSASMGSPMLESLTLLKTTLEK
jgi:hypothetical protein